MKSLQRMVLSFAAYFIAGGLGDSAFADDTPQSIQAYTGAGAHYSDQTVMPVLQVRLNGPIDAKITGELDVWASAYRGPTEEYLRVVRAIHAHNLTPEFEEAVDELAWTHYELNLAAGARGILAQSVFWRAGLNLMVQSSPGQYEQLNADPINVTPNITGLMKLGPYAGIGLRRVLQKASIEASINAQYLKGVHAFPGASVDYLNEFENANFKPVDHTAEHLQLSLDSHVLHAGRLPHVGLIEA